MKIRATHHSIFHRKLTSGRRAFTLIEMLAVITIIGVLAGLSVGVGSLVSRKSKVSRTKSDLARLEMAIRDYHSKLGFYPPDNLQDAESLAVDPLVNQLYYELSGAEFDRGNGDYLVGGELISRSNYLGIFGNGGTVGGIYNSSASKANVKNFLAGGRSEGAEHITENPHLDVLAVPVNWPVNHPRARVGHPDYDPAFVPPLQGIATVKPATATEDAVDLRWVNPWRYVSSNPTNNPGEFDLWAEIVVGDEILVIGNWDEE